ncbi:MULTISPECIES: hypothetical protein [Nostocales]|jgi:hypothetical protein|uniref:Uncharacterized protein n=1 Tax=Dolichospermum flos-aquae UHCC 0037 TaxID=2590026 RepID=A0ACC7S1S0_DOLFA|nr:MULTISPECIES: hypothetical protein [Nostocales]ALB40409.1 hypothetical protein AA650_07905 [Anabaena sp. WA102]MBO1064095.1 hypothetical protein [Anabaena sp. 54]MTJ41961.1 hypothetical protein [Dolichospermum flos-aquae UHCC 0037]
MIFNISPSQIESLDSKELVELLKKLLHAEAQSSGICLRGVSVPLQITVPDGGEDARISWTGGCEKTNYLTSRFCIFQSKATKLGKTGWKKEVWTKPSQKKDAKRELNNALKTTINENGSYIGFTSEIFIGTKKDDLITAIKEGIQEAGADPAQLKTIDVYDANKIKDWVSQYPAIAVWLNEKQSGLTLKNFQTIKRLGKKVDIASIPKIEDKANRFIIGTKNSDNSLTFEKVKERIIDYLADSRKSIRIIGSSGVGKTRFVYEVFRDETTTAKNSLAISAIYCDFSGIGNQILEIARSLLDGENSALMIVDECPRDIAIKLGEIITTEGSNLKIITIGNDNQPIEKDSCLNISVTPADETLIKGIIQQRYPKADDSDINFIKDLSGGYPRIAVLATDNYSEGSPILKSVEDVVERILTSCGINRAEQVRAIECLALFKQLGADENISDEIDFVGENLARQTGDEMYEHLAYAAKQNLVDHFGCYFIAKPLPIAVFLGTRRLDLLRVNTILKFIEIASPTLRASFLSQWRYFDDSKTAATVAQRLLARDGWCGSREHLKTELGSQCLNAIVHIDPDGVANVIHYLYKDLSIDDLKEAITRKHDFFQILAKLVLRKRYFYIAAPLLMRLAVIEDNTYSNDAGKRFKQLFQLHLSETEAEPDERFAIIDQGLSSGDERIISVCIDALENTLKRNYFSGSGISYQMGSKPVPEEWKPKVWGEIFYFHRNGLQKLDYIRSQYTKFSIQCENIIAKAIRSLICENLLDDIEQILAKITKEKQIWLDAIKGISDWLYFDSTKAPEEFLQKVRKLYDKLIPTDPIQKALLYTKFWHSHLRNPDIKYDQENRSTNDFEYADRKAKEVAAEIAVDKELTDRAIRIMIREELNNVFPFAHELAMKLEDPVQSFQLAINEFEISSDGKGINFLRALLSGIDKRDTEFANKCIHIARNCDALKHEISNIYRSVDISVGRLNEIIQRIRDGSIPVTECVYFSYGQALSQLNSEDIFSLIDELSSNHGSEGVWVSLEIISMYQHNKDILDRQLAKRIKEIITSKELFEKIRSATTDGYLFEELVLLMQKHYGIDDEFAIGLSNQVVRLCKVEEYQIFSALEKYCRNIIELLVKEKPILLWNNLSHFFEIATPSEIYRLEAIIRPQQDAFDVNSRNVGFNYKEGILFGISDSIFREWAKVNPEIRASFLCIFYPMLEIDDQGNHRWHPALEKLTHEFGASKEFRQALAPRLFPNIWSGSRIPYLGIYLTPLETWFNHPVPEMSVWSKDMYYFLEREIVSERKREGKNS